MLRNPYLIEYEYGNDGNLVSFEITNLKLEYHIRWFNSELTIGGLTGSRKPDASINVGEYLEGWRIDREDSIPEKVFDDIWLKIREEQDRR